jgi:fructose-bisphosphate aldolase, class II
MTLTTTAGLLADAVARESGLLAFNVITLEHAEGILSGAVHAGRPVVLQVSENAIRYHDGSAAPLLRACADLVADHEADAALHLDHITDPALLEHPELSGALGISSVMFDASTDDYDSNVARTAEVAKDLHDRGLLVEAELGEVGGKGGAHTPGVRTDPRQAAEFVEATRVDALAVAVGSSHAMTTRTARLDQDLLRRIADMVPVPLVLHGSSGVPADQLRAAVANGMRKINVGTALNVGFTAAVREALAADPDLTDPRRYLTSARGAVADVAATMLRDVLDG